MKVRVQLPPGKVKLKCCLKKFVTELITVSVVNYSATLAFFPLGLFYERYSMPTSNVPREFTCNNIRNFFAYTVFYFLGKTINESYFPILVPLGIIGNFLSFLVSCNI